MSIITRYITREFLKLFLLCLITCVALFFVIDFSVQYIENLEKYNPPFLLSLAACLFKLPQMFYWLFPVATLLATFLTLALFSRNNEITAMKASGISAYSIVTPLLVASVCIMVISFCNQELALPAASQKAKYIENIQIKQKKGRRLLKQDRFWYRTEDAICNIELFEHNTNTLYGITVFYFSDGFTLARRLDARHGKWINGRWHFFDVVTRTFTPEGVQRVETAAEKVMSLTETPEDFKLARKEPEEMSFLELREYIAKIQRAGYKVPEYIPYLHAKLSFPFTCLIMPIIAIPFALRIGRGGGIPRGIGASLLIGFSYFVLYNFGISLGKGGVLSPLFSAWAANIFFATLGTYYLLRVRQ
jgi:lipopolysaccharide export system permease protein